MKKVALILIIVSFTVMVKAQKSSNEFKPFKVDLSLGFAKPSGEGAKGGILISLEPKYSINDNIAVGLRMESALMARTAIEGESADIKACGSYLATGDYYFSNKTFRPFAGLGLGFYKVYGQTVSVNSLTDDDFSIGYKATSKFGSMIRAGFEAGHFRMGLEYNLIGKSDINVGLGDLALVNVKQKNNYLGIKIGVCFGGGRVK